MNFLGLSVNTRSPVHFLAHRTPKSALANSSQATYIKGNQITIRLRCQAFHFFFFYWFLSKLPSTSLGIFVCRPVWLFNLFEGIVFFYSAHITFVKHIKHSLLHARNSRACLVEWFECSMVVFGLFALIYPSWVWVAILSATLDWVCVCCDFVWLLGVCVTATGMDSIFQSMEPTRTTSYEQHIKYPKIFLLCSIINGNCILSVFGKESSIETLMMS